MSMEHIFLSLIILNVFFIVLVIILSLQKKNKNKWTNELFTKRDFEQFRSNITSYIWQQHRIRVEAANKEGLFMNETKSIILVEGRSHHLLEPCLRNLKAILPKWKLHLIHIKTNTNFVIDILQKIGLENIERTCLQVEEFNVIDFSTMIGKPDFWINIVKTDRVLITQTDAWLCHNSTHNIEEFYIYDYVGAPWASNMNQVSPSQDNTYLVGNCGFCLCKRDAMLATVEKYPFEDFVKITRSHAVDIYFARYVTNTAPAEIAKVFSVETVWYDRPIGVHKPFGMNKHVLNRLQPNCEGILQLLTY